MIVNIKNNRHLNIYLMLIIILLLLLYAVLAIYFQSTLKNEIKNYEISKMASIQQVIDRELNELRRIAINALFDKELSLNVVKENEYNSKLACTRLMQYKNSSTIIHEAFLYFRGDNSILSTTGKTDLHIVSRNYFNLSNAEFERLLQDINNPYTPGLLNISVNDSTIEPMSKEQITLRFSESVNPDGHNASILLIIDRNALQKLIDNIFGAYKGKILLFDQKGSEILSFGDGQNQEYLQVEEALKGKTQPGVIEVELNKNKFYSLKVFSSISGWHYTMTIPETILAQAAKSTERQLIWSTRITISILFLSLIALLVILYLNSPRCTYKDDQKFSDLEVKDGNFEYPLERENETLLNNKEIEIPNIKEVTTEDSVKEDITTHISPFRKSGNQKTKEDILEFINMDFRSNMLSLETVSRKLGISPGYLSRYFKDQVGIKFIDYVRQLRITEAKKLLVESDMDIKCIVKKIGYNDTANFIRSFKTEVGLTPGEYRKSRINMRS